ncbi:MAG TPA: SRPBCC family protein [Noviherbaspirillum sp.]|nr:SRPBCC family protein [Noviherbaspirillum sp.]
MKRIQHSIEIGVPVHIAYDQLTQFENYPRFMEDVAAVERIDDAHLHWTTRMSNREVEWDATITERAPDRCISWHNTSGPTMIGKVELEPTGSNVSRVTLTLESEPDQVPGSPAGNSEEEMTQRLQQDLSRLKQLVETRHQDHPEDKQAGRSASVVTSSTYAAGSEGWDGTEDPTEPVVSSMHNTENQTHTRSSLSPSAPQQAASSDSAMQVPEAGRTTQSDYSLSQAADEESENQRFSVAEEVSFDQQSDAVRHIGQAPQDIHAGAEEMEPSEGMAKSLEQNKDAAEAKQLKESIERATPPSP